MLLSIMAWVKPLRIDRKTLGEDVTPSAFECFLHILDRTENDSAIDSRKHLCGIFLSLFIGTADQEYFSRVPIVV